jgi:ankyrin repeat protein
MNQRKEPPLPPIFFYHARLVEAIKQNRAAEVDSLLGKFDYSRLGALLPVAEMGVEDSQGSHFYGSPYSLAAHLGRTEVVKVFCHHQIPQHLPDYPSNYLTPLQSAVRMRHTDIVRLLLLNRGGNSVTWPFWPDGPKVFMQAVSSECVEITKMLIDAGADVEADASLGISRPLQLAAFIGNVDLVKLLLAGDASPYARNSLGETALDIATIEGQEDVVAVLEKSSVVHRRAKSV